MVAPVFISGRTNQARFKTIPLFSNNDTAYTTAKGKANVFCQTFADKCRLPDADDQSPSMTRSTPTSLNKVIFKPKNIRRILQQLQPDKASGPDLIPSRVLKECCAELAGPLSRLFQLCFSCGVFPDKWKPASVTPVHKRNSRAEPSNYRPISLLSTISKVMEAAIHKQLQQPHLRQAVRVPTSS